MGRIVFKHLYNFSWKNLFNKYQAGFLPGHSTVYRLIETYDYILKAIDEGKTTCVVFCDLSKAFDRVWHKGLLFKLKTYGIKCNLLRWFQSYVVNRTQRVVYRNSYVSVNTLYAGVLSGSVLGPLLFLIYVNDANNMLTFCRLDNSLQDS